MSKSLKQRYISSAFLLMVAMAAVKIISAVYKIPLTSYIGALGRGYFSTAYNLYLPIHALTMGAFPLALTKLLSQYEAKGDVIKTSALRKASKKLFLLAGGVGMIIMLVAAKPYAHLVSDGDGGVYTILALAPSIFFSCLCACDRAFCEGYLDMKCTAVSQIIEALIKTVFGLLFARAAMSVLIDEYSVKGTVLGNSVSSDSEALLTIYPLTSAAAMLGVTLGCFVSFIFAYFYTRCKYTVLKSDKRDTSDAFSELVMFSVSLVGATAVQSVSAFADNFSVQYCLSEYNPQLLSKLFNTDIEAVATYVYGIYSTVLDFKNLVPSIVMTLGVAAVPAVSSAFESSDQRFSYLVTSIFKYSAILSACGGVFLALFSRDLLQVFYSKSPDIVENSATLLYYMGVTVMPCCLASTAIFCTQALGYSKNTIVPFAVSAVIRVGMNFVLIPIERINILAAPASNFVGYLIILIWNFIIISGKTHCRLNFNEILVKPIIASVLTYYMTKSAIQFILSSAEGIVRFIVGAAIFLSIYIIMLLLFRCISLKEINNNNKI